MPKASPSPFCDHECLNTLSRLFRAKHYFLSLSLCKCQQRSQKHFQIRIVLISSLLWPLPEVHLRSLQGVVPVSAADVVVVLVLLLMLLLFLCCC